MEWLKQIAPTIAAAVGGPLGSLAYEVVGKALGMSADEASQALTENKLTGEQLAQIKLAELELQKRAQELGLNFESLAVDDRKSAREMQIKTQSWLVPTLGILILLSFVSMVASILLGFSKVDGALAGSLIGLISVNAGQVVSFYFGSSHGSQKKDELLYTAKE